MPIGNNSGRIMNGYKKWLTKKQRSRLSGLYRGLRQSTADEMRDQYLDQRGSMNRVRDVASSYGLGEGYRARKQMTFDRAQERYGRQLAMQADNAFESEVVKAANESIQAENERRQKEYARRLKAAQNKRRAAQNKYNRDMAAYNEQQARLERLRSMKTPKTAQTWKAPVVSNGTTPAHVSPFSWQAHTLTQYTDTGTGNNSPKGGGKSGLIAAALLAGHTGKRLAKGNGTTKPRAGANNSGGKISGKVGRYTDTGTGKNTTASPTQKMIGRPDAPNFETDPSFALPLDPQMQAQLDVQLKEYQAATPEQQEQIKLGAKDQYAKDVAQYAGAMERLNTLQRGVQQAQSIMAQFQDLEAKIRNTRYSPEQRRGFSQQLSGLQRQYASVMQQQRGASQEISGLQRYIQNAFPRINASRALLGGMGIKYDIDSIAFDADWVRRGNQLVDSNIVDLASNPNRQSDRAKEFWKRADAIGIDTTNVNVLGDNPTGTSYTAVGQKGSTISMTEPEREWFDANGFGNILRAVERDLQYNTQYASLGDAVRGYLQQYGRQSFDYQRSRNAHLKVSAFVNTADKDKAALIREGESKTNLTKILNDTKKYGDIDSLAYDATGVKNNKNDSQSIAVSEALGVNKDYVSTNTVAVLKRDPASVAFLNFCIANGDMQAVKDYLFEITENANAIMGDIEADRISDERKTPFFKAVHEAFIQFGNGAYSMFENIGRMFSNEVAPTAQWQYTSSGITRNKVERGWNPQFAQTFDSALQSAGNNAAAFLVGGAIGKVGGALGGVAAKIASHAPGAIMGLSAAGQAKQQALREGYGAKAATMYGIFNGISETVLQENVGGLVGFGDRGALTKALTNAVNSVKSPVARTLINQGLDILSEIGEEEFGNIVENINRSVTLGEKRGLFDDFADQAGETAVSTAISTFLLNALHIPAQLRSERGYSAIANASGMSLKDAKLLLETEAAIKNGEQVDPKDLSRYNELTAVLTAAMPENVAKAIADGKMTVTDWVTSAEGVTQGKLMGKLSASERTAVQTEAVDHTEKLKGKTEEQKRDYLLAAAPTGKVGSAYYTTTDGKPINIRNLNTTQKANYVLAQKCAKAFEGSVDVVIHDTLPVSNGAMVGSDGKLHIALDTTNEQGRESIAYWTLAHESGHALKIADIEAWNEMFGILTDYAKNYKDRDGKNLYDALVDSITNQYKYDSNSDAFNDEMFSLIAERMVGSEGEQWAATLGDNTIFDAIANDRNASAKAKKGFLGKLKTSVEKLSRQFRDGGFSKERKHLAKIREQLTEAYKRINEGDSVREKYAEQSAQRRKETPAITRKVEVREGENLVAEKGIEGKTGTVRYGAGNKQTLKFHYAAVNVNDLVTSHTLDGSINDAYPTELQPRDRSRASSQQQILDIGNDIIPEKLGAYPGVQEGAPIIGKDMIVESGNGRTIALRYAAKNGKLKGYTAWLKEHASEYGLKAEDIKPNTVLVRVRDSEVNRADFAKEANKTTIATMNATERAQTDADALESILNKYRFTEGANFNSSANSDFFSAFVDKVAGVNEANALLTSKGTLSNEGVTRIQNALFELAYHDKTLTEQFTEGDENPLRNIIKAMLNVAPVVAKTTADIAKGDFYDVNFASDFVAAERFLKDLKNNPDMDGLRKAEAYYEAYPSNLVEENPEYLKKLEIAIDNNLRSQRSLSYLLNRIIEGVQKLGSPNQLDMFGGMVDTSTAEAVNELKEQIVDRAVDALEQQKEEWANSTRFQHRATDTEYLSLAEKYRDGTASAEDINVLNKAVEEAAREAGYNSPKLYHGTGDFGFTKFDLAKGEHAIFATSNKEVAKTYVGDIDTSRLSEGQTRHKVDVDALKGDALLSAAKKYLGDKYKGYRPLSQWEKAEEVNSQRAKLRGIADKAEAFFEENKYAFDANKKGIADDIVAYIKALAEATDGNIDEAYGHYDSALWGLKYADDSFGAEFALAFNRDISECFNRMRDFLYAGDIFTNNTAWLTHYVFDNQIALEVSAELNKGLLELYGKLGKTLDIDAKGRNWNDIRNWKPQATKESTTVVSSTEDENHFDLVDKQTGKKYAEADLVSGAKERLGKDGIHDLLLMKAKAISEIVDENGAKTRDVAEWAFANGYSSVIIRNVRDVSTATNYRGTGDVYIFNAANAVKSADPVTYDDNGDIIPLSERFRTDREGDEAWKNEDIRFSLRTAPAPKKTQDVYKLMRLGKDGKLYPLFIDSANGIEVGKWYDADSPDFSFMQKMPEGVFLVDTDTQEYTSLQEYQRKIGDKKSRKFPAKEWVDEATKNGQRWVTIEPSEKAVKRYEGENRRYYNIGINGSGSVSTFAMRPGWHAGSLPTMRQIGKGSNKNLRDDSFVWVKGRVPADVDYQAEAERNIDKDIPTHIPKEGYYLKATNANADASQADRVGWYVAGSFIADEIIGDIDARNAIDAWNKAHPEEEPVEYDFERESGKIFNAKTMSLEDSSRYQQRDFRIDFNVPQLDTKALHEAVKGGEGTVENRFEVKYEKTDSGFAVHITDKDSGKTYDRAETVTEGNAKAEAERAAAAVIRNIKRGKPDSKSKSTAGIYIEPGANAARSSAVPVSYEDENGNIRRNSKVARTMIEAGWMTDEQAERFADEVHDGIMSYEPVTNAEAKAYAEEKVSEHPAAAQADWEAMYNSFAIPSDKDLAVGYQLMANAANDGDFDMMLKLGTELREMMTKAGQAIQSMNLLKQMGAVADVYRIDQAVQKMNDDLMKAAKGYFISVNPDLVEALLKTKPDTQEYDKALETLYKDIASQIKPSLSDALTEYRYLAMLGNPRTHIRNLVGNAVFMPAVAMKNVFGTILEGIRYGSNSAMKTKALVYGKQYGQFAKEDWGKVKTTIKSTGNKYRDMMSDIDNYRNHFGKGLGWLDKVAKFNGKLLEGEDMLFKQAYYRTALAAELSAKKVNLNDLRAAIEARDSGAKMQKDSAEFKLLSVYEEARARAIKEANVNTYNDANKFARDLNAFSRGGGKLRHMMVEGLLPFKNTPANIVSRSIEYSPVGLINSVTREAVKLHKGEIGANEFLDKIARGFSGSAIFALGVWLAKAGVLVGPLGDDKEDKEKKRRGHQAFSVEIAGKSYTLDWMAPVCIPLFTGVALYEMLEKEGNGEHWSQYAMNALTGMLEPITKMSMLEGIENLIDSLAYSDSKLEDAAITVGTSYLTQFVPTLSGQIARSIDPYTRRTYSDKESMLPRLVDKFVQTVQKKIPGWNQSLQPYVNELGEAEKEESLLWRIFDNFISPGFRSAISNTKLDKELERLGDPSIYPSAASKSFTYNKATYNLHADEYTAFATARGTTAGTLMNSLVDSKAYQGLTDLDQVKAQAKAIEYANAIAKAGILNMRGILDSDIDWDALGSWVPKANEYAKLSDSPTALADYIAIKTYTDGMKAEGSSRFGNVADYTVTNKDGTTTIKWNDMKYDYLQSLDLSDKERLYLADAFGIKNGAYEQAQAAVAEVPNLTVDAYTKALDHWQDLTLEKAQKKEALSEAEYEKWLAVNTNAFKKYLNDTKDLTGQQKFALLTKIGSSDGWEGKANTLRKDYGVSYDDAWKAAYKASTLTSTDEASKNAQYMAYLNSTKLDGKQKFGLYGSFGSSTSGTLEKATAFVTGGKYNGGKDSAAAFGKPSYDALWNAYTAYNGGVQHEAYYDWLSKQSGLNAQQRFACCEFVQSASAWMERAAEANSKMGIGYDTLWKIKVYWRNESGQGKKARITAYCKKLGLRQSQVDRLYALKFLS